MAQEEHADTMSRFVSTAVFADLGAALLNTADDAQSPHAASRDYESVVAKMGSPAVDQFMRLYTAPAVERVGSGAPANVDPPVEVPLPVTRSRPLCEGPQWPRYKGGSTAQAANF